MAAVWVTMSLSTRFSNDSTGNNVPAMTENEKNNDYI
jgi:hypothetical protein